MIKNEKKFQKNAQHYCKYHVIRPMGKQILKLKKINLSNNKQEKGF
jgi:hypothetical protein